MFDYLAFFEHYLFLPRDPSFGWFALSCLLWLLFISHF